MRGKWPFMQARRPLAGLTAQKRRRNQNTSCTLSFTLQPGSQRVSPADIPVKRLSQALPERAVSVHVRRYYSCPHGKKPFARSRAFLSRSRSKAFFFCHAHFQLLKLAGNNNHPHTSFFSSFFTIRPGRASVKSLFPPWPCTAFSSRRCHISGWGNTRPPGARWHNPVPQSAQAPPCRLPPAVLSLHTLSQ